MALSSWTSVYEWDDKAITLLSFQRWMPIYFPHVTELARWVLAVCHWLWITPKLSFILRIQEFPGKCWIIYRSQEKDASWPNCGSLRLVTKNDDVNVTSSDVLMPDKLSQTTHMRIRQRMVSNGRRNEPERGGNIFKIGMMLLKWALVWREPNKFMNINRDHSDEF